MRVSRLAGGLTDHGSYADNDTTISGIKLGRQTSTRRNVQRTQIKRVNS